MSDQLVWALGPTIVGISCLMGAAFALRGGAASRSSTPDKSDYRTSPVPVLQVSDYRVYQALAVFNHAEGLSFGDYEPELS